MSDVVACSRCGFSITAAHQQSAEWQESHLCVICLWGQPPQATPDDPDPRTRVAGICGATRETERFSWVCIKPVHGTAYTRKQSDRTHARGDLIINDTRTSEAHYYVNRYPNRPVT